MAAAPFGAPRSDAEPPISAWRRSALECATMASVAACLLSLSRIFVTRWAEISMPCFSQICL